MELIIESSVSYTNHSRAISLLMEMVKYGGDWKLITQTINHSYEKHEYHFRDYDKLILEHDLLFRNGNVILDFNEQYPISVERIK